jgi:hypothetical protein
MLLERACFNLTTISFLWQLDSLQLTGPSIRKEDDEVVFEEEKEGQCNAHAWPTSSRVTRLGQNCVMPKPSGSISSSDNTLGGKSAPAAAGAEGKAVTSQARVLDPGLLSQWFQMGRYLLIASSRPGSQPANLQVWVFNYSF